MARNNNTAAAETKAAEAIPVPKGMKVLTADIEAWYKPEKGVPLHVKLLAMEERSDRPGTYFFVCELRAPSKAVKKGDEEVMLGEGATIGVGEKKGLLKLRRYVQAQEEAFIVPLEKIQLQGGKSFWKFKVWATGREGQLPSIVAPQAQGGDDDLDDLPFH